MNKIFRSACLAVPAALVVIMCSVMCGCMTAPRQQMFATQEKAVDAFVAAVRSNDIKTLEKILGPDASDIISSGDETDDKAARAMFLKYYDRKNSIVKVRERKAEIVIGEEAWPFPIPVISRKGQWFFDTDAGREEILDRRVGRNELSTIQTLLAVVDAQREYAMKDRDADGILEYAEKFKSVSGAKDGLYWKAAADEEQSPLGLMAARAQEERYTAKSGEEGNQPYHGYIFRIIKEQGANATGGAFEYVVNGNMIGGFAVVAFPAQYGNSGVMTFSVNYDGVVYQKDLGPDTADIAAKIDAYDTDASWQKTKSKID